MQSFTGLTNHRHSGAICHHCHPNTTFSISGQKEVPAFVDILVYLIEEIARTFAAATGSRTEDSLGKRQKPYLLGQALCLG